MANLPIKLVKGSVLWKLGLGTSISKSAVCSHIPNHDFICTTSSRCISTGSSLYRSVYKLSLTKSRVNMQKTKHLQFTSDYIQSKVVEYNLGTRRLALIMGKDPETFTQEDIDESIAYLFPSDLHKTAQPKLQHPSQVYPSKTVINADEHGRPLHDLFYTNNPEFYQLMHEIYQKRLDLQKVHAHELADKVLDIPVSEESTEKHMQNIRGTQWLSQNEVEEKFFKGAPIQEKQYKDLIEQLRRLMEEPKIHLIDDYIKQFRKVVVKQVSEDSIAEPQPTADGRHFVEAKGERKSAKATVRLIYPGTGKITVNDKSFGKYFYVLRSRQIVVAPFSLLGYQRAFDVEARVESPLQINYNKRYKTTSEHERRADAQTNVTARTSHAVAIRMALSTALRSYVGPKALEALRIAGLLAHDMRNKERKLPGRRKARKRFTWKKR